MSITVPTKNARLTAWVEEIATLTQPDEIYWCDGSAEEYDRLAQQLVDAGTFKRLSGQAPQLVPRLVGSLRRRARRGPDVHLLGRRAGRRPDQQLARPR